MSIQGCLSDVLSSLMSPRRVKGFFSSLLEIESGLGGRDRLPDEDQLPADLPRFSNERIVERLNGRDPGLKRRRDVDRILRPDPMVPDHVLSQLGRVSGYIADTDVGF